MTPMEKEIHDIIIKRIKQKKTTQGKIAKKYGISNCRRISAVIGFRAEKAHVRKRQEKFIRKIIAKELHIPYHVLWERELFLALGGDKSNEMQKVLQKTGQIHTN